MAARVPRVGGRRGRARDREGAARAALPAGPDTYVRRGAEPPDLRLRSLAAYRHVEGRGVLSGYSAARLVGADCAGPDAPAEVTVPGGGQREHPGLRVHRGALPAAEIVPCRGALVTSPVRTAHDLGRRPDLVDAVVGIDALANARRFDPADVLTLAQRHPGRRGRGSCAPRWIWPTGVRARRWRPACA